MSQDVHCMGWRLQERADGGSQRGTAVEGESEVHSRGVGSMEEWSGHGTGALRVSGKVADELSKIGVTNAH